MKYFATISALVSVIPGIWSMTINTPTGVTQCQPVLLTWSDGTAPYYLSILPGGQPAAQPLETFPTQNGNSMTWMCDMAAGTVVSYALKDSTGATAYTDMVTIQPSQDSSCLNSNSAAPAPMAAVATVATDTVVPAGGVSSGTASVAAGTSSSRPAMASAGTVATRATTTPLQTPQQTIARPTLTTAAAAGTTSTTSGAQSRFAVGGSVLVGVLSLLGAILL